MNDAIVHVPDPVNEPTLMYAPGSPERARLKAALRDVEREVVEIPCVVGGQEIRTGRTVDVAMPCDHGHVLAKLRCEDGSTPIRDHDTAEAARVGNVGKGGRCGSIIDLYQVKCPEATYELFVDGYVCPQ